MVWTYSVRVSVEDIVNKSLAPNFEISSFFSQKRL